MNDLKFAFRQLLKNPGFTAVSVLTLALAIGAGTSVFSLFNAILLRSLPVPNPEELRVLQWSGSETRVPSLVGHSVNEGGRQVAECVAEPVFRGLRAGAAEVADVFAFAPVEDFAVRVNGEAITAEGAIVSDNFFSGLGLKPLLGQVFAPDDLSPEAAHGIVLSADWWLRHFAGNPVAIGQTVILSDQTFTVLGVLPPGFRGVRPGVPTEFYVLNVAGSPLVDRPASVNQDRHWWLRLMARVRPGVDDARLQSVFSGVFAREAGEFMKDARILVEPGRDGVTLDRDSYRKPLRYMLGVVGLVLLVACANLAGLMLARNAARQHELAVRVALGASHWRCMRQSLTESLALSVLGGGLGLLLALWGRTLMGNLLVGSPTGVQFEPSLDLPVLGAALLMVIATALLTGILPALFAGGVDPNGALRERSSLGTSRLRSGKVLVVAQISLSLVLLSAAGLYVRTVVNLDRIDVGFDTGHLLLFQLRPADTGYRGAALVEFYERVLGTLGFLPGVKDAALIHYPLLGNQSSQGGFTLSGRPEAQPGELETHRLLVSENFFATLGIPLLRGEVWRRGETNSVVVNEAFVRKFTPTQEPIGQTLSLWGRTWRITGVCRDIKHQNIREGSPPTTYFSFQGRVPPATSFVVRTKVPPLELVTSVRNAVARVDPAVPVASITTQEQVRDGTISQERLFAKFGGSLGVLAVLLSCLGLYGLMAYTVTRRQGEFAIRMAIGAQRGDVARSVLREALALTLLGCALGIPTVLAVTRMFKSQLFGVAPHDPLTVGAVVTALATVALVSAWLPARRATHVDPMTAFRQI